MAKKSGGAALRRVFDAAELPLFVIDGKRKLAYCNPAFREWSGYSLEDLAERRLDYHTPTEGDPRAQFAAALAPPPQAFQSAEFHDAELVAVSAKGESLHQAVRFFPLDGTPPAAGLVAVVRPLESLTAASPVDEPSRLHAEVATLRREMAATFQMDRLLGVSPAIRKARKQLELATLARASVLVVGPPGSGREHIARSIYHNSKDHQHGMLVPLSCSILDAELLKTTIDALSGSQDQESAAASALLLLDVDLLPSPCQDVLRDWLLNTETPLRTIASTRTSLELLADQQRFRRDLAMTLSTLTIQLPPLSERREDIAILAQAFLEDSNPDGDEQRGGFTPEAMEALVQHDYGENLDELRGVVSRAAASGRNGLIGIDDLPQEIRWAAAEHAHPRRELEEIDLDQLLAEIEAELIGRAMAAAKGNRAQAAKLLGVSRAKLIRRLAED